MEPYNTKGKAIEIIRLGFSNTIYQPLLQKVNIHSSCEIEELVETHIYKLCA